MADAMPTLPAPATPTEGVQLTVLLDMCGAETAEALPQGVSSLSAKELRFVEGLLSGQSAAGAARLAGYGTGHTAETMGSRLMGTPAIARFVGRCLERAGLRAETLTARVAERAHRAHARAVAAQAALNELDWQMQEETDAAKLARLRTRLTEVRQEVREACELARKEDTLLATILGKVGIEVRGSVTVGGQVTVGIDPATVAEIAALRAQAAPERSAA